MNKNLKEDNITHKWTNLQKKYSYPTVVSATWYKNSNKSTLQVTKETIWHFTCTSCSAWFSVASSDNYNPIEKEFFCPTCGKKDKVINKK